MRHPGTRAARSGKVIALVALSRAAVVGAVALTADGGLLVEHRRQVQMAADAAAMAAANNLYANWIVNGGADTNGYAADRAKETATSMGYTNNVGGATVKVNIPPASGPHTGETGYVEVLIDYNQPRYFSRI